MDSPTKNDLRERLQSALAQARSDGAEMLSVAFPPLPPSAFDALARSPNAPVIFFFENAQKNPAEIALDFRNDFFSCEKASFPTLKNAFPRTRKKISLAEEKSPLVPAPKIFVAGTFGNSARPFAAIPTWQISRTEKETQIGAHVFLTGEKLPDAETLCSEFLQIKAISETPGQTRPLPKVLSETELGGETYLNRAIHAIGEIEAGNFEKIVLARAKDFAFPSEENFPSETLCATLRERFLDGGCTIFSARTNARNPHEKIVGATPEMLVRLRNGILETEALAGTIAKDSRAPEMLAAQLLADAKELREHRFVVDFIVGKLRSFGLNPRFPQTPNVRRLPNVFHLHTPIEAAVPAQTVSLGEIASELHPTPAMCGVPAQSAEKFICENEPFPRENFSAPVGFLDADGNGFFAVAIRCAKIFDGKIRLYAGSGLVCGSSPQREFDEIEAKLSALSALLR
ncbi:MAG: isochorismate synthase [Opitutales bacterium]|nr:isochorismate synthase [Opitutales bacterium]